MSVYNIPEDTRLSILRYVGERSNVDISTDRLLDEISSYEPNFNLEEILLALEKRDMLLKKYQGTRELEFYRYLQTNYSNFVQNDYPGYVAEFYNDEFDASEPNGKTERELKRIFGSSVVVKYSEPNVFVNFIYDNPNLVADLYILDEIYSPSIPTLESLRPKNNIVWGSSPGA